MCAPGAPWTPPQGGCPTLPPLGGCCGTVHDPSPAHAGGSGHPCQGVSPTVVDSCWLLWRAVDEPSPISSNLAAILER